MVALVRASCAVCGDIAIDGARSDCGLLFYPEQIVLLFTCPKCRETVSKPAPDDVIQLLRKGGIAAELLVIPAEVLNESGGSTDCNR